MKNILLIATGGTIASTLTEIGLMPAFNAQQLLSFLPEIKNLCHVTGISIMSIDSTNMNPKRMSEIGRAVFDHYNDYDGFVISHGTDTMAYTASALTYMLQGIQKPVVVMGSQMTIDDEFTDAKQNISDAIRFTLEPLAGVFVVFDGKLMVGTRTMKMKTRSMDAFSSVNFPTVATIKFGKVSYDRAMQYEEYSEILDRNQLKQLQFRPNLCEEVFVVKMFPGINPEIFDYLMTHYKGVVIESFGIGGIPSSPEHDIVKKIREMIAAGMVVVITTQCLEEGIDLEVYQVGKELAKESVIYGADMNTEAITMKLMWALGNIEGIEGVKTFVEMPVFGDKML
ncbi:MAG: asparaginase [Vallitaleaceae bacterium]|nr:asparaginase [Vallitaleaceae bacterium]